MHALLIATALAVGGTEPATFTSASEAAVSLADDVQTGTLRFSTGDCLAVRVFTSSPYTHVAAVVVRDGEPYIYDSQNGAGVRRLTLNEYLTRQSPETLYVYVPARPFSERRAELFSAHLEEELGRPYAVKHHLTGKRADGLHCAEYLTDALMACRLVRAESPPRVSPASLREGLLKSGLYEELLVVEIRRPEAVAAQDANWCERLWFDTVLCTKTCCRKMSGWFLCR